MLNLLLAVTVHVTMVVLVVRPKKTFVRTTCVKTEVYALQMNVVIVVSVHVATLVNSVTLLSMLAL